MIARDIMRFSFLLEFPTTATTRPNPLPATPNLIEISKLVFNWFDGARGKDHTDDIRDCPYDNGTSIPKLFCDRPENWLGDALSEVLYRQCHR